ncbi:MAG: glycosyltransferase family 4 protein [Oligoflexia bacterium]|nr:glycosyltransferase family 4 protein [Oligoflexia bacterium]
MDTNETKIQIVDHSHGGAFAELTARLLQRHKVSQRSPGYKVGIDARVLYFSPSMERGIGAYTMSHLGHMFRLCSDWEFYLCVDEYHENEYFRELLGFPNVRVKTVEQNVALDLFHIPDPMSIIAGFDSPFLVAPRGPSSAIFYDLTPLTMREMHFDRWEPLSQIAYRSRLKQMRACGCQVLAISESTKSDLVKLCGFPAERITPIMAGLNSNKVSGSPGEGELQAARLRYGLNKPFFLVVGGLEAHKNFPVTANAFITARGSRDIQLAVVGGTADPYKNVFREALQREGVTDVVFTGFVSREDLTCLYNTAAGLVFPSRYEGFGFPPLEAMANRCPVITSNVSSLPEICGDAALLVSPDDQEGIARAMVRLVDDRTLRAQLVDRGMRRAQQFTWERTAALTRQSWEGLISPNALTQGGAPEPRSTGARAT